MQKKVVGASPLGTLVDTLAHSFQPEVDASAEDASVKGTWPASSLASAKLSLAELYDLYAQNVYRLLIGLGISPSRAEDAMQDVFVIASRGLRTFEGVAYKSWLFQIARFVARNARRAMQRADAQLLDDAPLVDTSSSPFAHVVRAQEIRLLNTLLDQLDERHREVFVLAELEQLTQAEIADALGVHVNTVSNRLAAARSKLERLLRRYQEVTGQEDEP